MTLPSSLTTVTTLSKTLALIIFITLPIVCFILGINYGLTISSFSSKYSIVNSVSSLTQSSNSSNDTSGSINCRVTNCHGLDVICDSGVSRLSPCSALYSVGDKCREYIKCENTNGTCQKTEDPRYVSCKSCVEKCINSFGSDSVDISNCESKCN